MKNVTATAEFNLKKGSNPMTDPIKEQAEELKYLFYGGRCYRIMPEGSSFTARKSEMLNVSKAIEKHIREKEELRKKLDPVDCGETEGDRRFKTEQDFKDKQIKSIEARCLELTQACRDFLLVCSSMNTAKHRERIVDWDDEPILPQRKEWIEYFLEAKSDFEQTLSSPASRKYLNMIEVVEAAKKWEKQSQYGCPEAVVLEDAVRILESEEANEGD